MPRVTFKAKPYTITNVDGSNERRAVDVPTLTRKHCDMSAFRAHAKFGPYANSDLFLSILRRVREGFGSRIYVDSPPKGVDVDASGFLAVVSFDISDWR
jgi:hypothetical protein